MKAMTIGELRDLLNTIIEKEGPDVKWCGYNNGSILIDASIVISIESGYDDKEENV
jgi:hypothetical protein